MQSGISKGLGTSKSGTGTVRKSAGGKIQIDLREPQFSSRAEARAPSATDNSSTAEKGGETKKRSVPISEGSGAPTLPAEKKKKLSSLHPDEEYVRTTFQFFNLGEAEKFSHAEAPLVSPFHAGFFNLFAHPFNALVFPSNVSKRQKRLTSNVEEANPGSIRYLNFPTDVEISKFSANFERKNRPDLQKTVEAVRGELKATETGCALVYTCAPDVMFALIYSAMVYVEMFHGRAQKFQTFWQGHSVESVAQYNSLSVMNKMTCRVAETFPEADAVKKNIQEIHSKMADFCLYFERMEGLKKSQRFLHYFCKHFSCTAPLKGGDAVVYEEELTKWRKNGCSLFANEEGHRVGSLHFQPDDGNYVSSLLDYVVFFRSSCEGGGRGELTVADGRVVRGFLESHHRLRCQKLVVLPFLRDHFVRFYAENVQVNFFADGVFTEFTGIPSSGVQFLDGTTDMDLLCPNRVPWGNCIRSEYFDQINCKRREATPSATWYNFQAEFPDGKGENAKEEQVEEGPSEPRWKAPAAFEADLSARLSGLKLDRVPAEVSVEMSGNKLSFDLHAEIDFGTTFAKPAIPKTQLAARQYQRAGSGGSLSQLNGYASQFASFEKFKDKMPLRANALGVKCVPDRPGATPQTSFLYYPADLEEGEEEGTVRNWFESKWAPDLLKAKHARVQTRTDSITSLWPSLFDLMGTAKEKKYDVAPKSGREGHSRVYRSLWHVPCEKERSETGYIAEVTKTDVERELKTYSSLGVTFRWFVGAKITRHYFKDVLGPDGSRYSPVAAAFCGIGDSGNTGGHYWCQCKLPYQHGLPEALSKSGLEEMGGTMNVFLDTPAEKFSPYSADKIRAGPVQEWGQTLAKTERVGLPVRNSIRSDPGIWYCYDDLNQSGPEDWDLTMQSGKSTPYQYSGENFNGNTLNEVLKKKGRLTEDQAASLKTSREYADLWIAAGQTRMEHNCIRRNYVSLCSASDNAVQKMPKNHDLCKVVDGWLEIANAFTKLDSIVYVKIKDA